MVFCFEQFSMTNSGARIKLELFCAIFFKTLKPTKGQLISKGLFGVIVWTKKPRKSFRGFLPQPLKRGQIKKIKVVLSYLKNKIKM